MSEFITHQQKVRTTQRFKSLMRDFWSKSPYREQALKRAKCQVPTGKKNKSNGKMKYKVQFRCAGCGKFFDRDEVEVDHIKELARINWQRPIDEIWEDLLLWASTLFCNIGNLQVLCKRCHTYKTAEYNKYLQLGGELL